MQREIVEEMGFMPLVLKTIPVEKFTNSKSNFTYTTYICLVEEGFVPKLNVEHKEYAWNRMDSWA